MANPSDTRHPLLMPHGVVQPFPLRFRRDDLHVMAFFEGHPNYEAVEAMIQLRADGGTSIRAIITRHDQSQIDHVNDDALLAAYHGTARECCRRDIDLDLQSSGAARRARLEFLSQAGERVVLEVVTAGPPDAQRGGLVDPGGHSASSSLPLMWRGASTLAGPLSKVTIGDVGFAVPVKLRAGPFVAHEGYYTERFSMGAIRAGTSTARLAKQPERLEVGAEWILQHGTSETTYRVSAQGADGALSIARQDGSGEIITAHAIGDRLAVTQIALATPTGATDGLVLAFDRHAGFGLSIESHRDVVSGDVQVVEAQDGSIISLRPVQPVWAADRCVHVACSSEGDQLRFVTTIGPVS